MASSSVASPEPIMAKLFADFKPGMEIHYVLGSDGEYRIVTKDTPEEVLQRLGPIEVIDICYMYPPVGAQHVNMAKALWLENPHFKEAMLACDDVAKPLLPQSILEVLYPHAEDEPMMADLIHQAQFAGPCLFAVSYALTAAWEAQYCAPSFVVGHSIGEFMAAVACGALDMPTAMKLVCSRASLMHSSVSCGAMMAVRTSAAVARAAIEAAGPPAASKVAVAAISAPEATTLSGEWSALSRVLQQLPPGTKTARVKGSHADHVSARRLRRWGARILSF